jgi:predicted nucleotidyltransferase
MRPNKKPNPELMAFFHDKIEPELPDLLRDFDRKLDENCFPPRRYYLHGSFTTGDPCRRSDVDIAVVYGGEYCSIIPFYKLLEERGTLAYVRGARIELTLYDEGTFRILQEQYPKAREINIEPLLSSPERLG